VRRAADDETDQSGMPLEKEHRLVVFPGMELTLSVPCQALLIFDADFPADMFALVLTALALNPTPDSDAKTAETGRLTRIQSLDQLKVDLDKYTFFRNRYIIFPNVGENGQFSLLRKGQAAK
jgi:chromosome segregation protein